MFLTFFLLPSIFVCSRNFQNLFVLNCLFNEYLYPILNQIYDILTELQNQGKQIILYKVPVLIGIKGNEEADKAVELETLNGKGNRKTVLSNYTTLNLEEWESVQLL